MENNTHLPAFIMAEHNKVARCGLSDMVNRKIKDTHHRVGDSNNYCTLINALQQHPNAVVLLCVSLPHFNITKHLYELNEKFPLAKIILSSDEYSLIYTEFVRQGNAAGYIVKCNLKASELLKAITMVTNGQPYLPTESLLLQTNNKELIDLNDPRTSQVFYLMIENKSQVVIAKRTGISTTTVNTLYTRIETIALQHSKYGAWGYAMVNNLLTLEMLREVHD